MLLAVETSGMQGSIALLQPAGTVTERPLQSAGRRHAQTLVADVAQLLQDCGSRPSDISAVAVSIGPGSFTGLRVGVVFAKTFAWINSAQLIAVDTLQVIAQQVPAVIPLVTAVVDAQRGEVFAADYRWNPSTQLREAVSELRIVAADQLSTETPLSGPGLTKLRERLPAGCLLTDSDLWQPAAGTVARIGQQQLLQGAVADLIALEPVYVRRSYAEEKAQPRG